MIGGIEMIGGIRAARSSVPVGMNVGRPGTPIRYRPGECNIGEAEIAARRQFALLATVATVGLEVLLLASGARRQVRALVGLPAAGAVIAIQQVRRRFCVAFGSRGVYNVAEPLGQVTRVDDAAAVRADRRRAGAIILQGAVVGVVTALLASRWP